MNTQEFVDSLVDARDWNVQTAHITECVLAGDTSSVLEIVESLAAYGATSVKPMVRQAIVDHALRALCLSPGFDSCTTALKVIPMAERLAPENRKLDATTLTASLIAHAQPLSVLEALFVEYRHDIQRLDVLACLAQETVIRGVLAQGTSLQLFWEDLPVHSPHPLSILPLELLSYERQVDLYLPNYGPRGSSHALPNTDDVVSLDTSEIDSPVMEWSLAKHPNAPPLAMTAAIDNWKEESNGVSITALFHSDAPVHPESLRSEAMIPMVAQSLNVSENHCTVQPVALSVVVGQLFAAASNGGAYNDGLGGAYGRLAMWKSISGMVGVDASIAEIAAEAEQCRWFTFDTASGWFYHVAWDLGIIALRPDGQTVALLAATDTD